MRAAAAIAATTIKPELTAIVRMFMGLRSC
jgi:hypothetical protein